MTLLTEPTRIVLSRTQIIPAVLGEPWGGGYFAGYISHTADGNPTHALIVAPRATGATGTGYSLATNLQWKTTATTTAGTGSSFDGAANTAAMVTAGIANHPAANFCKNLSIGGFTDWYLPAQDELNIAYFNLKPTTDLNDTSFGTNPYSVPPRPNNHSATYPFVTHVALFNTTQEAFAAGAHWSSTENAAGNARAPAFTTFSIGLQLKTNGSNVNVRAFRRIAL